MPCPWFSSCKRVEEEEGTGHGLASHQLEALSRSGGWGDGGYLWLISQDEGVLRQMLPEVCHCRSNRLSSGRTAKAGYSNITVTPTVVPQAGLLLWLLSISALDFCFHLS